MILIMPDHLANVCRFGEGAATCRYLTMGDGFRCGKSSPPVRASIDARAATMTAQGDNCDGLS